MKICLINSFYPPWVGGAERYVSSLAKGLVKNGNEVTVYCSSRPVCSGERMEDGVSVRRIRTPMMFYGTPIIGLPQSFFSETYDVIHTNFPGPLTASIGAFASGLRNVPAVLTWHNDLPPVTSSAGVLVAIHDVISPMYLRRFRKIIATTSVYAKTSHTLRRYSDRVMVIPNGVDCSRFRPDIDGTPIREQHGLGDTKVVLFVGALTRWHTYKGLDVLIRAFALVCLRFAGTKLLVVGDGPMRPVYESLARELGVRESVVFAGRVDDSDLPSYYAASDLLVLPSKDSSEGFGLVLLEAMASGKPVIGSRVGGVVDVIREGETGLLVEPNDPSSLAESIIDLLSDDGRRERMGALGRGFAASRDWSQIADRVRLVYEEIARR